MANFFQNNKYYLNHPEMQKNIMKKIVSFSKVPLLIALLNIQLIVIVMQKFRLKSLYKKSLGHSFLLGT